MLLRVCFVLLSFAVFPAAADTVWLTNGDRLSGDIVLLTGGKLVLQTKYAGRVEIKWKNVSTLESSQPLTVGRKGFEVEISRQLLAAEKGKVTLVNGGSHTLPLADIKELVVPRPVIKDLVLEGNLDFDLDLNRDDKSTNNLAIDVDGRMTHGRWRHGFDGEFEREKEDGKQTEDNWQLNYDLDRFITPRWFVRGSIFEWHDKFDEIEYQRLDGIGPGFQLWDDSRGRLALIGQYVRGRLETSQGDYDFDGFAGDWDYKRYLWGTRFELYSKSSVIWSNVSEVDYVFDGEAGLRYRLNDWARLSLLYELNQVSGSARAAGSEEHLSLGLGVAW